MTNLDDEPGRTTPSGAFSAAAKHAQHAMDGAKEMVAGTDFDQLRTKTSDTASAISAKVANSSPAARNAPGPRTR